MYWKGSVESSLHQTHTLCTIFRAGVVSSAGDCLRVVAPASLRSMVCTGMKRPSFFSIRMQWHHRLLAGFMLVFLTQAAGLGAVGFLGGWGYMIAGITCMALVGVFVALHPEETSAAGPLVFGLACVGAAFVSGMGMQYQKELLTGETLHGIAASELALHPRVAYAEFTDAKVFSEFAHCHRYVVRVSKSETRMRNCTVAPLANRNWTPAAPVPAWAALPDSGDASAWERDLKKAGTFSPQDAAAARSAVALAKEAKNLSGRDDAPVLHWGSHPSEHAWRFYSGARLIIVLAGTPWMLGVLLDGWRSLRLRRPTVSRPVN